MKRIRIGDQELFYLKRAYVSSNLSTIKVSAQISYVYLVPGAVVQS